MEDYEYYYQCACNDYDDACYEINRCENRIGDLGYQRKQKINLITQLKAEIKNYQAALEILTKAGQTDGALTGLLNKINSSTDEASGNLSQMVKASDVTCINLSDVYAEANTSTLRYQNDILDGIGTNENRVIIGLENLQVSVQNEENALEDIKCAIRRNEQDIEDLERAKRNAAIDMEYYRRKMNESFY